MKKSASFGNYTPDAAKAIKGSERLYCRIDDTDGDIYLCNGFVVYRMVAPEYAAYFQAVTRCEAGNWYMEKGVKKDDTRDFDPVKLFHDFARDNAADKAADRCPLIIPRKGGNLAAYHYPDTKQTAFFNVRYVDGLNPCSRLYFTRPNSGAILQDISGKPFALVMPVRGDERDARAVAAYCSNETAEDAATPDAADVDALRAERDKLRDDLRAAQEYGEAKRAENEELYTRIAALEAAAQAAPEQPTEGKPARSAAELIAARFTDFPGVSVTIKGAQTAAPVVWLTGATAEQADAIQAAGAKWSNKRGAYYVRCA